MKQSILKADTNLREGPGTEYKTRGLVGEGRSVAITKDGGGDWVQVEVLTGGQNGKLGYIYRDNIRGDR